MYERALGEADYQGQDRRGVCTWRHDLHVFGKLAADAIIISADVMETPSWQLFGIVELEKGKTEEEWEVITAVKEELD